VIAGRHAVVLSGGGANGAYEVGVMEALFSGRWQNDRGGPVVPDVFVGTSVGSYNAAAIVGLSSWGALAAVRELREIWLERISQDGERSNGVFRTRGGLANLSRDVTDLAFSWVPRGLDLAISTDPATRRLFRLLDGSDIISTSPLQALIDETIDPRRLVHGDVKLRIVACNWDTGRPVVFRAEASWLDARDAKDDYDVEPLTEANVKSAILASAAIPGLFPRVQIGDAYFVDGGVVMNTPLLPAIDAGATVLHVIHLEPKLAPLPLGRAPSAFESLERLLTATPARLIDGDIRYANLVNHIVAARASAVRPDDDELFKAFAKRAPIEIHRHFPHEQIGGMIGLLDFDRTRMADLVEHGFEDAVRHDCSSNGCVIPPALPSAVSQRVDQPAGNPLRPARPVAPGGGIAARRRGAKPRPQPRT
jgi:predicted acylesterase/phospholipase RssA